MSERRAFGWLAAGFVAYFALAWIVPDRYYQLILTLVPIWATVGVAWNLFSGWSGLMSFGHAAFFGLGAYTVALAMTLFGVSPWFGIPAAGVVGALAGLLVGVPTLRLRGHYFALAMMAYPLALLYVFEWLGWQEVTLPMHREAPAAYLQFADQRVYVGLALLLLALALGVQFAVARSRFGLSLLAIKQNEFAAAAAGIDPRVWKLRGLTLSAALTALAGGLYAVVLLIVTPPSVFGLLASAQALIVTLFGGMTTLIGPVVGALVLIPLGEMLNAQLGHRLPGIQGVVFGAAIIVIVLAAPEGIVPWLRERWRRRAPVTGLAPLAIDARPYQRDRPAPAGGEALLQVEGLSVRFGGLKANDRVSFEIRGGEIVGIIGPNGAGKTTLFNALNGFIVPAEGSVRFSGRELVGLAPHEICRAGVGRTFQVVRPFARLTLLQNVVVGAFAVEARDSASYERAREALALVGLQGREQRLGSALSTVELRLMELARALTARPRLLLLDEILAGLGGAEVEHVLKVIDTVRASGVTVVIIEHTMHAMVRLADRLLVLDHGSLIAQGAPAVVTSERAVVEAYLGKRWAQHARA